MPEENDGQQGTVGLSKPVESSGRFGMIPYVLMIFLVWRGLLFAFDVVGVSMTLERPDSQLSPKDPWRAFPGHPFWDGWVRWDAGWYRILVEHGYADRTWGSNPQAFFPLYPWTTRAVSEVVGNHWIAGLLVSNVSLLLALIYLSKIAARYLDEDGVRRSLIYLLIYPSSFFLSAYYSEGLFLLTTAAAFHGYLTGRYFRCGVWGFLAALTRPTGIALFAAFALDYVLKVATRRSRISPSVLWLLLIPAGLGTFMLLLYVDSGDPLAFVRAHGSWGRSFASPTQALWTALTNIDWSLPRDHVNTVTAMDAVTAALFLILPFRLFRRYDAALPIYALVLMLMPLATGSLKSMLRLEVVSFPVFLTLAELGKNREVDRVIIFVSAIFLGLLNLRFSNWYWVG
ncbi:mannosyltransferase family protein [Singulisphaera rosea]